MGQLLTFLTTFKDPNTVIILILIFGVFWFIYWFANYMKEQNDNSREYNKEIIYSSQKHGEKMVRAINKMAKQMGQTQKAIRVLTDKFVGVETKLSEVKNDVDIKLDEVKNDVEEMQDEIKNLKGGVKYDK